MKQHTITTYSFNELSKDGKQKALDKYRYFNVEDVDTWSDFIQEDFREDMQSLGYQVKDIFFSGFSSQGDGACFVGTVSIVDWIKAHKLESEYRELLGYAKDHDSSIEIEHVGRYSHERSMSYRDYILDITDNVGDELVSQSDQVYELIKEESIEKAQNLYETLEAEYDYQISDEVIAESLTINEYDFTEEGAIY